MVLLEKKGLRLVSVEFKINITISIFFTFSEIKKDKKATQSSLLWTQKSILALWTFLSVERGDRGREISLK